MILSTIERRGGPEGWGFDFRGGKVEHHAMLSKMKWAFALNLGFACLELVGGLWVNSMAVVSDAIHDFGDALSLAMGIWLEQKSKKAGDHRFTYGYRRFSLLAAVFTGGVLLTGSLLVLANSIQRLLNPEPVNAPWMVAFAVFGVAVNGVAFLKLRSGRGEGHGHHHHHHHGHSHTHHEHKHDHDHDRASGVHVRMWELHFIEDLLGWVIVLIGGLLMVFYPLLWLDAALAIGLSVWIIYNVLRNLKATFVILLQGMPTSQDIPLIEAYLKTVVEVASIHHLHVWSIDGDSHIMTGHLVLKENITLESLGELKSRIKTELKNKFQIREATLEFEWEGEDCADPHHRH